MPDLDYSRTTRSNILSSFFELSPVPCYIATANGILVEINPAMLDLLGFPKDALLKTPYLDLIHKEDRKATAQEIERLNNGQSSVSFANRCRKSSGQHGLFEWTAHRDPTSGLVMALAHDVSPRKDQLTESELEREAINFSTDYVIWIQMSGEILRANATAKHVYKYTSDEFQSLVFKDLFAAHSEFDWNDVRSGLAESPSLEITDHHITYDGTQFPVSIFFHLTSFEGQKAVCAFVRNMTEYHVESEKLKAISARFHLVLDNAVEAVIVIDETGIVQQFNRAAESMFGYPAEEVVGMNVSMLMPQDHSQQHDDYLKNYLRTGTKKIIGTTRKLQGLRKSKEFFPIELSISESKLENTSYFTGFIRDVSEQVEAERRYDQAMKLLQSLNEVQREFVSEVEQNDIFDSLLTSMLELTGSDYGFIGEILEKNGEPYLKTHAITNIAWNEETRRFYEENVQSGLEFYNLDTLFGHVIRNHAPVISNSPKDDPRSGGQPPQHPPMHSFLGLPFLRDDEICGMIGLANRPGGYDRKLVEFLDPLLMTSTGLIQGFRERDNRKRIEVELSELAQFDSLTGLANRREFTAHLAEGLRRAHRYGEDLALAFLDLDHFKKVNDTYGHHIGDEVLVGFASVLSELTRDTDLACRLGGEEFAVILTNVTENVAGVAAQRILSAIEARVFESANNQRFQITCSCGIVLAEQDDTPETLTRLADEALYAAKDAGRNRIHLSSR